MDPCAVVSHEAVVREAVFSAFGEFGFWGTLLALVLAVVGILIAIIYAQQSHRESAAIRAAAGSIEANVQTLRVINGELLGNALGLIAKSQDANQETLQQTVSYFTSGQTPKTIAEEAKSENERDLAEIVKTVQTLADQKQLTADRVKEIVQEAMGSATDNTARAATSGVLPPAADVVAKVLWNLAREQDAEFVWETDALRELGPHMRTQTATRCLGLMEEAGIIRRVQLGGEAKKIMINSFSQLLSMGRYVTLDTNDAAGELEVD